jgi:outer membrane lipoprotein carrier protein
MQAGRCRFWTSAHILRAAFCLLYFLMVFAPSVRSADLPDVIAGLQKRYASVETVKGNFQQSYRAPGIQREQTGEFCLRKPGLMHWEYKTPEPQLFVADGKRSFLYVPGDRQVTIQPLSPADLHNTPLSFLLGSGDINKTFFVAWETATKAKLENTFVIRLVPRKPQSDFSYLVLELDQKSYDLRRIVMKEPSGSTSEFILSNVAVNTKLDNNIFHFKTPKGVEEIRLNNEE